MRVAAHAREHRARRSRRGRRARVDGQRIARGCRRDGGLYGLHLLVGQLLRLVAHQHVHREATARTLRTGDELNAATVLQHDGLLTVRGPDIGDQLRQFGELARVLEVVFHTQEMLAAGLHLMRRMQDLHAEDRGKVQLRELENRVLAVLTRHRAPAIRRRPLQLRIRGEPTLKHDALPLVRLHVVAGSERARLSSLGLRVLGNQSEARFLYASSSCHPRSPSASVVRLSRQAAYAAPASGLPPA